ncbi:MAG TPA: AraC family transcriptional regulator [Pyrinomonadaceae bacterium]
MPNIMHYREIQPGPSAARFVKCYWLLEDGCPAPIVQTIVPDGRCELIINLGQPSQQENGGYWCTQPEMFFVGQITGPLLLRPQGSIRTIGIRFHPHGAGHMLGLPIVELTNTLVPLADVSRTLESQLNHLRDLSSVTQQLELLDLIIAGVADSTVEDRLISEAVNAVERTIGLISISQLAQFVGLSSRHFERRFINAVGVSPKFFCRLQRFQRVIRTIEHSQKTWVETAVACGYYDQAHLIRDFREFSGATPTAMLTEEFALTREFS